MLPEHLRRDVVSDAGDAVPLRDDGRSSGGEQHPCGFGGDGDRLAIGSFEEMDLADGLPDFDVAAQITASATH